LRLLAVSNGRHIELELPPLGTGDSLMTLPAKKARFAGRSARQCRITHHGPGFESRTGQETHNTLDDLNLHGQSQDLTGHHWVGWPLKVEVRQGQSGNSTLDAPPRPQPA
jgi:hypothetical protein